jgi:hypothetical protein
MQPRIYTYKITFEEIPHWYWGVHKEKKFGELYLGTPVTHRWMWEFYTPHLQILEFFPNTEEGWGEAQRVEKRLISPDLNNSLCLNESCGGFLSYEACRRGSISAHSKRDELGRSLLGLRNAQRLNAEKDERGFSLQAIKNAERMHREKDEWGRSVLGVQNAERMHREKDELGRSVQGVKNSDRLNSEKDERGRSVNAVKAGKSANSKKDEQGRSINGVKNAEKLNAKKDENGKSIAGVKGSSTTNTQLWMSTADGFISTAGPVSLHNRFIGADPNARIRIK